MSKRVLVTGGAGFVGHHVIDYILRETDWDVVSLDRLDTSGTLNRLADILQRHPDAASRVDVVFHDLKAPLNELVERRIGPVQYVAHIAASSHVDRSIDFPMEFVLDNVVGTCNILDFARHHKTLEKFLYFSTDEVFGPAPEGVFYKEWDRYNSGNPYAATKAGAEELVLAYQNTYRLPLVISHTMNIFGVRQHPEKYIPLVISKVLKEETVFIHSNPDKTKAGTRHYINTEDVADAVVLLLEKGVPGEKYNIVGEREVDNLTLAQMIAEGMGRELKYEMVDFHSSRPGHDLRYSLDGAKMRKDFDWEPRQPVSVRLKEVIDWTLENRYWIGE